jgi:hypothetical protein
MVSFTFPHFTPGEKKTLAPMGGGGGHIARLYAGAKGKTTATAGNRAQAIHPQHNHYIDPSSLQEWPKAKSLTLITQDLHAFLSIYYYILVSQINNQCLQLGRHYPATSLRVLQLPW